MTVPETISERYGDNTNRKKNLHEHQHIARVLLVAAFYSSANNSGVSIE
jgi:hypothetical protein